jgi:putative phosphonate metabolism protein
MSERYAIYYAPPTTSELWQRAARWLGRDPATGSVSNDGIAGIDGTTLTAITPSATRYGFHATLKAPFPLAAGESRADLEAALQAFSLRHGRVSLGKLELRLLDGFLALTPVLQSAALTEFAGKVVADFDGFRAPMTASERERRLKSNLTAYQIGLMDHYGYPYVMDQFLFHMTLTDRMPPEQQETVIAAASEWFAPVLGQDMILDRLSLFHEPESGAPFIRATDFPLSSEVKV